MIDLGLTLPQLSPLAGGALGLMLGLLLGLVHFASLYRVTQLYTIDRRPGLALVLQLGRLALVAAVLFGLALLGALPLLAGAGGMLIARLLVLRRHRKET